MSSIIKVESGVPLPDPNGRKSKYPWDSMKEGDSFFVPCADGDRVRMQNALASVSRQHRPHKFTARQVDGGIRVWRIA